MNAHATANLPKGCLMVHDQQNLHIGVVQLRPKNNSNANRKNNQGHSGKYHHKKWKKVAVSILFTLLAVATSIIIVCLTGSKQPEITCKRTFQRIEQTEATFDSKPQHAAVADFNQDTHRDIVVGNTAFDTISVRLGYGNATFTNQTFYSTGTGSQPVWVATGDLNNDHFIDIAVANYGTNCIGVFLGNGNGTFSNYKILSLDASRPISLGIGHFNNDMHSDIAVATDGTFFVMILHGRGDGSFDLSVSYFMGYDSMPRSIVVADMNSDSRSDVVLVNYGTSELVLFLSDDNDTLTKRKYSTGINSYPTSVSVEHFNHDNYLDIALTNSGTQNIGVFLGEGNGQFGAMKTYFAYPDAHLQYIVAHTIRNDGHCDLAVVGSRYNYLLIFYGDGDGFFTLATKQFTGYSSDPFSIVVDDFNKNNQSNVIVIGNGNNNIQVYTSYTPSITVTQTSYETGSFSYPKFLAAHDFNHDGHLDLAVANYNAQSIAVFIGRGDGTFRNQQTLSISSDFRSYVIADFNKDNKLDIALFIPISDQIDIYFGLGDGTFDFQQSYSLVYDSYPFWMAVDDFNNDGNLDLVTVNRYTDNLAIMLGRVDGTFMEPTYYNFTINDSAPTYVAVGDLNNDGWSDIVTVFAQSATMIIFLGSTNGSFQKPDSRSLGTYYATDIHLGDLNNDQTIDIVLSSSNSDIIRVLLGNGDGTFSNGHTYVTSGSGPVWDIILGDFDTNKILDIAAVKPIASHVIIFLRHTNESLTREIIVPMENNYGPYYVAAGDFNNDNETDLVVANSNSDTITVLLLKYEATYTKVTSYDQGTGKHPFSIVMADFDNDHRMDIAVANSGTDNVDLLTQYDDHHRTFQKTITRSTGEQSSPRGIAAADFNRDDQLDIAVTNYVNHSIMIIVNPTDDNLTRSYTYSTGAGSFPVGVSTGDVNNDGWTDVIVTNSKANNLNVFLGFKYPRYAVDRIIEHPFGSVPVFVAVADFNNDSIQDLAVLLDDTLTVEILLRDRNGSYQNISSNEICAHFDTKSLVIGDFNNDNHWDLAVGCSRSAQISILLGAGDGTFPTSTSVSTGYFWPEFITAADLNHDGKLDIVVANRIDDTIGVSLGIGNGSLAEQVLYSVGNGSRPVWIAVGDLNDDGILDLAVANKAANNIAMYFGSGDGAFHNLTIYSTGNNSTPVSVVIGDFDKDNHTDFAVLNAGARSVGIFYDYGNATFAPPVMYETKLNSYLNSMLIDDLNNDTILDIVVSDIADENSNIHVLYGLRNRRYLVPKTYSIPYFTEMSLMAIKDLNKNGRMDILFTMSKIDQIGFMAAVGDEPLGGSMSHFTGTDSNPVALAVSDFNNDDRLDIAVVNSKMSDILILLGDGKGNFIDGNRYSTGTNAVPNSITVGDIDGDKQQDMLVTNSNTHEFGIFFGFGNGKFTTVRTYSTGIGSEPSSISIADFDKDNLMDVVIAIAGTSIIYVYYGNGNRTFSRIESYSFEFGYRTHAVAIEDVNNDGWLDIGVAHNGPSTIDVLLHRCHGGRSIL